MACGARASAGMMLTRGAMIHRCIAMYWYFVTTICIDTADPMYHDSHETILVFLKRINQNTCFFLIRLMEILWYNSSKLRFGSTSGSCSSRYSIHWSSRLCAGLLITCRCLCFHATHYVPLTCYCVSKRIEIRIVSWPLYRDTNRIVRHPYRYTPNVDLVYKDCLVHKFLFTSSEARKGLNCIVLSPWLWKPTLCFSVIACMISMA